MKFTKNNSIIAYGSLLGLCVMLSSCEVDTPKDASDMILTDVGGYISFQNPVENVNTGTVVGGTPISLSYYAPGEECFPYENVRRVVNREYLDRKYTNTFEGNVGFLAWGTSAVSGSVNLTKEHIVVIAVNGIEVEYLNAIDMTRWYREGMDPICKDYLDEFGFIVQAAKTSKLSVSIYDKSGIQVHLDETNINDWLTISADVNWEITNEYRLDITTPHYLGYHLGQLRKADGQMVRYRAKSEKDGRFLFEKDGAFEDASADADLESFKIRNNPNLFHLYIPTPLQSELIRK
ncbi:hypothetical protein GW915_06260 [bacterium]|nr:hypothetical protein [bacterium]